MGLVFRSIVLVGLLIAGSFVFAKDEGKDKPTAECLEYLSTKGAAKAEIRRVEERWRNEMGLRLSTFIEETNQKIEVKNQEYLAKLIGKSQSFAGKLVNGTGAVTTEIAEKIALDFGKKFSDLFVHADSEVKYFSYRGKIQSVLDEKSKNLKLGEKFSQAWLASEVEVSQTTVFAINNETRLVNQSIAVDIAYALDQKFEDLFYKAPETELWKAKGSALKLLVSKNNKTLKDPSTIAANRKYSRIDLAHILGLSNGQFSRLEQGVIALSIEEAKVLAQVLQTDSKALLACSLLEEYGFQKLEDLFKVSWLNQSAYLAAFQDIVTYCQTP